MLECAPADVVLADGRAHVAGMNAVFCDGSVHHIKFGVDKDVFAALCNRQDGVPIDLSQAE